MHVSYASITSKQPITLSLALYSPKTPTAFPYPKAVPSFTVTAGVFADYQIRVIHHGGWGRG